MQRATARRLPSFGFEYFAITMGTGIVAVLLPTISGRLSVIAQWLTIVNVIGFGILVALLAAWLGWRRAQVRALVATPTRLVFLGCVPMAMSSVGNDVLKLTPHLFGPRTATVLAAWLGLTLLATFVSVLWVPVRIFAHHLASLEDLNATWLLPIVPAEVTAFQLSLLVAHLARPLAIELTWAGYVLWAFSVPLALSLIALVTLRLLTHHLPAAQLATSTWLILGPLGTGAAAIVTLGHDLASLSPSPLATTLAGAGLVGALVLAGYGLWWLIVAGALSLEYRRRRTYPYTIGWWGFTFPLGVLTTAIDAIASATRVPAFHELGVVLAVLLVALWLMVASSTLIAALRDRRAASEARTLALVD